MKTRTDVARLMAQIFADCQGTCEEGQKQYAHDEENILRNFEALAADLGISREKALWVYTKKHLDGILAYINGHQSQHENVRGRIKDVIVYLVLFWAMVDDNDETGALGEATEFADFNSEMIEQAIIALVNAGYAVKKS